jgi:hypothetical protein
MAINPETVFNIADSVEDISQCRYLVQCKFGMSAQIGRIWKLGPVEMAEIPQKDWDDKLIDECSNNRIRFGNFSGGWIQINIRRKNRLSIYRTNGKRVIPIEVKKFG